MWLHGEVVSNANIDVWQSDEDGLYDVQHTEIDHTQARGILHTNGEGQYWFKSILAFPSVAVGTAVTCRPRTDPYGTTA